MTTPADDDATRPRSALHGPKSEVSWNKDGLAGEGRQPYANQGQRESPPASNGSEFEAGDRGELSGNNLEQFEEAKKKP